jgi:hypothetical protein
MNKFIKRTLLFSAPVIISMLIMEVLLRRIPNDYSYKKNYLEKHSNEIETLFLGSSHAYYAINPDYMHSKSFNVAYVSQSLDYDIEILKKYEKQMDKLKYIVIPFDSYSLYNRLQTAVESWRIKNYNIYYGFNSSYNFNDNFEFLNVKLQENIVRIRRFYCYNKSIKNYNYLGWGSTNSSRTDLDLIATGIAAAQRHAIKERSFFNENLIVLNEIISIAQSKNAKVIFYTSPAYKTYTTQLNKEQLQKAYATIKKISNSNDNVSYFDFLTDPSFVKEDFFDADHLNEIGAEKFSKKMDSIIISLR